MGLGDGEGVTHDDSRHGTTALFAPLEVATGETTAPCKRSYRHQDVLGVLRKIEKSVPRDCDGHWIVDHSCTHRTAKVRTLLAQRPRFQVHAMPTDSCWLHQVEGWFGFITQRVIWRLCWQLSEPTA